MYTYGDAAWGDLLTAYDGVAISYDQMGNPLTDGTWTYTWEHGRQLASMAKSSTTWTYTYDANGMRTSRSNGTDTYTYIYNGGQLVQMTVGTHTLYFTYDAGGTPATVTLDGTTYYYITNLQGDVVAIWDQTSNYICDYYYDAWGKVISRSDNSNHLIDDLNPLLYRGYVYDTDTGLYYLQSRYYNPEIGRFLNADALVSTGQGTLGNNMFTYCLNNPVTLSDASGAAAKVCLTADSAIDDTPWHNRNPGSGAFTNRQTYSGTYGKISGLINGQEIFEYANARCGIGDYARNGCAIIAIYNAMQLIGNAQSLGSIENEFLMDHGMILWGAFGSGPWSFDNYFAAHGISNSGYGQYNSLMQNISDGDVIVFTVWNKKWDIAEGFHTMAAQYLGGQFVVYNYYMRSSSVLYTNSLDTLGSDKGWLYGYIIGG